MRSKLLTQPIYRYILAGASSYAIELVFLFFLYKAVGLSAEASTAIAFWLGLFVSFSLQKLFAFSDYQRAIKVIARQFGAYSILVTFNYVFTLGVVAVFPSKWLLFSRTLALVIVTVWNYFIYKRLFLGLKK